MLRSTARANTLPRPVPLSRKYRSSASEIATSGALEAGTTLASNFNPSSCEWKRSSRNDSRYLSNLWDSADADFCALVIGRVSRDIANRSLLNQYFKVRWYIAYEVEKAISALQIARWPRLHPCPQSFSAANVNLRKPKIWTVGLEPRNWELLPDEGVCFLSFAPAQHITVTVNHSSYPSMHHLPGYEHLPWIWHRTNCTIVTYPNLPNIGSVSINKLARNSNGQINW